MPWRYIDSQCWFKEYSIYTWKFSISIVLFIFSLMDNIYLQSKEMNVYIDLCSYNLLSFKHLHVIIIFFLYLIRLSLVIQVNFWFFAKKIIQMNISKIHQRKINRNHLIALLFYPMIIMKLFFQYRQILRFIVYHFHFEHIQISVHFYIPKILI